jgi:hexosaminidase
MEKNGLKSKIQEFMKKNSWQTSMICKLILIIIDWPKFTTKLMGWEEIMTENMSKDIIHAWRGTNEGLKPESLIQAAKGLQCCLSMAISI